MATRSSRLPTFLLSMCLASVFSLIAAWSCPCSGVPVIHRCGPLALPLVRLSGDRVAPEPASRGAEAAGLASPRNADKLFLRTIARRTWRYFSDFVNEGTSWLPPDNYQVSYQNQLAMRTSPTNIGLWMVSVLGAHQFGYISVDDVIDKLTATMGTIGSLERHEGHLLNWYDIQTLAPLKPRYVSTVDSGNLLGALVTLDHGLTDFWARLSSTEERSPVFMMQVRVLRLTIASERSPAVDPEVLGSLLQRMGYSTGSHRGHYRWAPEGKASGSGHGHNGRSIGQGCGECGCPDRTDAGSARHLVECHRPLSRMDRDPGREDRRGSRPARSGNATHSCRGASTCAVAA